jgi:acyl-CoA dehydrogenase
MTAGASELGIAIGEDLPEIRESIRRVCADFPGAYWRDVESRSAYPSEFVAALTSGGYLAVLIPEAYGGAGLSLRAASVILEEIHASGGNAGACHAQMYTMGTLLRHGSAAQKQQYLPKIAAGELRLLAFGVTEPTSERAITTSSTAKRCGHRVRCTPI